MDPENQYISKTQKKKEAKALQELGVRLLRLNAGQLEVMDLPGDLKKALLEAKAIRSKVAGRRQEQFIGALMREVAPDTIHRALDKLETGLPAKSEEDREIGLWFERLSTGDPVHMETFLERYPDLPRQQLRQLLRNVKKEKTADKKTRSQKALEQMIRQCLTQDA
ncbi:MAG: DUF615 domain-containing protein [Desulfobacteraceae bacterium]|nr:MAG: DUF615 domain-containing protein [Desulfobacteraceae bacterium]